MQNRTKFFSSLLKDVEKFEAEDLQNGSHPDHPDKESMQAQVERAIRRTKRQEEVFERLLLDVNSSLHTVSSPGLVSAFCKYVELSLRNPRCMSFAPSSRTILP